MGKLPVLVKAGGLIGTMSGMGVGFMVTPPLVGALAGGLVFGICGVIAGLAMHRQDTREVRRGKELDEIIGITQGSMGAPPGSIPPGDLRREPLDGLELEIWASEWLTPPPPPTIG
jgi:hypothetical protein